MKSSFNPRARVGRGLIMSKNMVNRLALALPILALAGCAELNQIATDIQKVKIPAPAPAPAPAPVMVSDTLLQICQAAKNNPVQAESTYVGKGLAVTGEVGRISDGIYNRYHVLLKADPAKIHVGTNNKAEVSALTTGKAARASGVIEDVSYEFNGCSISLKDVTLTN